VFFVSGLPPCHFPFPLRLLAPLAVQFRLLGCTVNETEQNRGREELVRALSLRFVELRRRAGMTQKDAAEAMGRDRSGKVLVCRLERGAIANASLSSVAEYLRAVRAGFGDLKDVLDRYTSVPIPPPVRKLAAAAPPPRKPATSVTLALPPGACRTALAFDPRQQKQLEVETLRVRRRAGYWVLRKVFEHFLHGELTAVNASPASWLRRRMATYCRKVFNAHFRTRGPKEPKRAERMARLRAWGLKHNLTKPLAEYLEFAVGLAFDDMREHDELDWLPPADEAHAIMSVKPKHRVVTDAQMCLAEWWEVNNRYALAAQETYERAHKAATDLVPTAGCDARTLARYKQAAMWATNIGCNTVAGTPRRKQNVADFHAADWPPELDRKLIARLLSTALEIWDAARPTFPPAPGPKPQ
jgi:transcriptional regulator with XRE-family HTH domain